MIVNYYDKKFFRYKKLEIWIIVFLLNCYVYRNLKKVEFRMDKLKRVFDEVDVKVVFFRNRFEILIKEVVELKIKLDKENETI